MQMSCPGCGSPLSVAGVQDEPGDHRVRYRCQPCFVQYDQRDGAGPLTKVDGSGPALHPNPPDASRLFFVTTDGESRQFLFFRGRGEDIYWGAPGKGQLVEATTSIEGQSMTLTVGEPVGERRSMKVSYHESGQVHIKQGGEMTDDGPMFSPPPAGLSAPVFAGLLITKLPVHYEPYRKPVVGAAQSFVLDEVAERRRFQVEVFFTPPGQHELPYKGLAPAPTTLVPHAMFTVTARLIVVVRLRQMGPDFSEFHSEKTLWMVAGNGW